MYSGLRFLLDERGLTAVALARRIAELGAAVDARTLQRLSDPDRPIKQVDARVVALLCDALHIEIGGLLAVMPPHSARLDQLSDEEQARLDDLLDQQRDGALRDGEFGELHALVERAGQQSVRNAQRLVEHRQRLRDAVLAHHQSAAD
jgi:hypothetical protein